MSTTSEKNQFRRLIGDFGRNNVIDSEIEGYLDDATRESTEDFVNSSRVSAPVTDFDALVPIYHTEVIYLAAINWWWDFAAKESRKHSQTMGASAQNVSETYDRALQMIDRLRTEYTRIQSLGTDINMGNLSRFSKQTLTRLGGQSEEDALQS